MPPSNSQFLSLVPDGWFHRYLSYMNATHNEMPLPFHFLSLAVVMGHALGFQVWGKVAANVMVYPNINALLLGPAGGVRRGEGSKLAIRVARLAGLNVMEGKATPEGLLDELRDHQQVLLYVEELSMLLSKRDYMRPMIPLLTKLLLNSGGPVEERTRTAREKITIERANLSFLATSAPDWFIDSIPEEAYGGGLMSRLTVCYLPGREVIYIDPNAEDDGGEFFVSMATEMCQLLAHTPPGHMKFTRDAVDVLLPWYQENERRLIADERLNPHRNRLPANVIRLAIILSVSCGERVISRARFEQAVKLLEWFAPTVWAMYGYTDAAANDVNRRERRVVQTLIDNGGKMKHAAFARATLGAFGCRRTWQDCLAGLEEKGLVRRWQRPGQPAGVWPPGEWEVVDVQPS